MHVPACATAIHPSMPRVCYKRRWGSYTFGTKLPQRDEPTGRWFVSSASFPCCTTEAVFFSAFARACDSLPPPPSEPDSHVPDISCPAVPLSPLKHLSLHSYMLPRFFPFL